MKDDSINFFHARLSFNHPHAVGLVAKWSDACSTMEDARSRIPDCLSPLVVIAVVVVVVIVVVVVVVILQSLCMLH